MSLLSKGFVLKIAEKREISSICSMPSRNFSEAAAQFVTTRCAALVSNFRLFAAIGASDAHDLNYFGGTLFEMSFSRKVISSPVSLETECRTAVDGGIQFSLIPVKPRLDRGARNQVLLTTDVGEYRGLEEFEHQLTERRLS